MAATAQLRGMLLEEIVLKFLEGNGYHVILAAGADPTLDDGPSGIEVVGRGTRHQVDAIADYRFSPPFSQRYRLLVEGKSLKGPSASRPSGMRSASCGTSAKHGTSGTSPGFIISTRFSATDDRQH